MKTSTKDQIIEYESGEFTPQNEDPGKQVYGYYKRVGNKVYIKIDIIQKMTLWQKVKKFFGYESGSRLDEKKFKYNIGESDKLNEEVKGLPYE